MWWKPTIVFSICRCMRHWDTRHTVFKLRPVSSQWSSFNCLTTYAIHSAARDVIRPSRLLANRSCGIAVVDGMACCRINLFIASEHSNIKLRIHRQLRFEWQLSAHNSISINTQTWPCHDKYYCRWRNRINRKYRNVEMRTCGICAAT